MQPATRATVLAAALGAAMLMPAPCVLANEGEEAPAEVRRELTKKWGNLGPIYDLAVRFAKGGRYRDAITLLTALKRQDDPRVLNYLGYSHRKHGRVEEAVGYYEKALTLAPEFTSARQYLGEAWLQLGHPDKARLQLAEIEALCGKGCGDYRDLERAIAAHAKGAPAPAASW